MDQNAPREIALVIGQLEHGGTERQLYFFLERYNPLEWKPTVFVSGGLGCWEERIRSIDVPVVQLRGDRIAKLLQFRAACLRQDIKCMFSWSSYTNGFALGLLGTGIKCIGSFRNSGWYDLPEDWRALWRWSSVAGVSTLVCNSQSTASMVAATYNRKIVHFVPNAVEIFPEHKRAAARAHWRAKLGVGEETALVVGVGRITSQKNFGRFVDAVAHLSPDLPVKAVIAGQDFGEQSAIEQRLVALNMKQRVKILGEIPDARDLICAADIFLLSSDYEGTPNVVLEAMAAKVPCVVTFVDGVRELISHEGNGLSTELNSEALGNAVARLVRDPILRRTLGAAAQCSVLKYAVDNVAAELWAICAGASAAAKPIARL